MLNVKDIKKGDVFFESAYGLTIKLEAIEDAKEYISESGEPFVFNGKVHKQYKVDAKDQDGNIIEFLQTENMGAYGPNLYRECDTDYMTQTLKAY